MECTGVNRFRHECMSRGPKTIDELIYGRDSTTSGSRGASNGTSAGSQQSAGGTTSGGTTSDTPFFGNSYTKTIGEDGSETWTSEQGTGTNIGQGVGLASSGLGLYGGLQNTFGWFGGTSDNELRQNQLDALKENRSALQEQLQMLRDDRDTKKKNRSALAKTL
jgi:hypothetical protein